jgi:hypothetical protein
MIDEINNIVGMKYSIFFNDENKNKYIHNITEDQTSRYSQKYI